MEVSSQIRHAGIIPVGSSRKMTRSWMLASREAWQTCKLKRGLERLDSKRLAELLLNFHMMPALVLFT